MYEMYHIVEKIRTKGIVLYGMEVAVFICRGLD
jgi:hypothetical protein